MASAIAHELTRVGPGTVMGQLMREYWIPQPNRANSW